MRQQNRDQRQIQACREPWYRTRECSRGISDFSTVVPLSLQEGIWAATFQSSPRGLQETFRLRDVVGMFG